MQNNEKLITLVVLTCLLVCSYQKNYYRPLFHFATYIRHLSISVVLMMYAVTATAGIIAVSDSNKGVWADSIAYLDINTHYFSKRAYDAQDNPLVTQEKLLRFADCYQTSLTPHNAGNWVRGQTGRVWRLGIHSAGAYSLYLSFQHLQLAPGVSLCVYSEDGQQLRGPFTAQTLQAGRFFAVAPLEGDKVIVTLSVPDSVATYGNIEITKVYHDRLHFFGRHMKGAALLPPSSCEESINCENGVFWQTEKRAVCKIIVDGALCTGTLVANTSHSREPYLLTAYHILFDQTHAAEAIFLFNYEYPHCGSDTAEEAQAVSGARLLATAEGLDYALLQLNQAPPASFRPYYAGWDVSNVTPDLPAVTIHHPGGQPKQIAMAYRYLSAADYTESYQPNAFWNVQWDVGVTAPGSSGSPLFNKQHRLIGTLTGGTAACGKEGTDYFNKLATCWQAPAREGIPLMDWLDAAHTGQTVMDGYDPYGFDPSACRTAWNILPNEAMEIPAPGMPGSSQQEGSSTPLAEKYLLVGALQLPAVYLNVAAVNSDAPTDGIYLHIWEGARHPLRLLHTQKVLLSKLTQGVNQVVLDSVVTIQGNFFVGYEPAYDPTSSFVLYRAANRGKEGPNSMYVYRAGGWYAANSINPQYTSALAIGISECYGRTARPNYAGIRIYPNPCSSYLYFDLPGGLIPDEVRCVDFKGSTMKVDFTPGVKNTVRFHLPQGAYILQVRSQQQWFHATFIAGR